MDDAAYRPPQVTMPHIAAPIGRFGMVLLHCGPEIFEGFASSVALGKQIGEAESKRPTRLDRAVLTFPADFLKGGKGLENQVLPNSDHGG